jgi:hypothetical protein
MRLRCRPTLALLQDVIVALGVGTPGVGVDPSIQPGPYRTPSRLFYLQLALPISRHLLLGWSGVNLGKPPFVPEPPRPAVSPLKLPGSVNVLCYNMKAGLTCRASPENPDPVVHSLVQLQ